MLGRLNIGKKIGYGYSVTIGIAVVGTFMGLMVGDYYQKEAQQQLLTANNQEKLLHHLEIAVWRVRCHQQQLLTVLGDSIWLEYEKSKFLGNVNEVKTQLDQIETFIAQNTNNLAVEDQEFKKLLNEYENTTALYSELIQAIWQEIKPVNLTPAEITLAQQKILNILGNQEAKQLNIKFEKLSEKLISLLQKAEKQQNIANDRVKEAYVLRVQILMGSMLFSGAIAILLAIYTSRAIALTLEQVIKVAQKVTTEDDFTLQAPITTQDEISVLAISLNKLIQEVKSLLEIRETELKYQQLQNEELKAAKMAADAANIAKNQFIAAMNHELRTPLNAILGFTEIIKNTCCFSQESSCEKQQEYLNIINRSGEHLLKLINEILEISKIEAGKITLNLSSFDLQSLLHSTKEIFSCLAKSKKLTLCYEQSSNLPQYVQTDESKLRQVLINLLSNAIKFTPNGKVTLRAINSSLSSIIFEVEDTGPGIAPEEIDTIFEPFTQTVAGLKAGEGTGLGLTISKEYVKIMGGQLTVESVVGRGSIFRFELQILPGKQGEKMADYQGVKSCCCNNQLNSEESCKILPLDVYLSQMPSEWIKQLEVAASKGFDDLIFQLIEQTPQISTPLKNALTNWANNFNFDSVLEIIEKGRRGETK